MTAQTAPRAPSASSPPVVSPASATAKAAPGQGGHKLPVEFDPPTWGQLEELAANLGTTRAGAVRRAVRTLSWIVSRLGDGWQLALLKDGQSPHLVQLF
jgi:hypothetical protein